MLLALFHHLAVRLKMQTDDRLSVRTPTPVAETWCKLWDSCSRSRLPLVPPLVAMLHGPVIRPPPAAAVATDDAFERRLGGA